MSKPKPGLGKVVRRTLVQGQSALSGGVSSHHPLASTSNGITNVVVSAHSSRRDFGTLGIPPSSSSGYRENGVSIGNGNTVVNGDEKGFRRPYSPTKNASGSGSNGGRGNSNVKGGVVVGRTSGRRLSTLSAPSTWIPPESPAHPLNSISWSFWSNWPKYWDNTALELVSPPSPPPSIRPSNGLRGEAIQQIALPSSEITNPILTTNFNSLGIPATNLQNQTSASTPVIGASSSQLVFHLGASGSAKERPKYKPPRNPSTPPPPRQRSFPLPPVTPPSVAELRSVGVGEDAYFARIDGMCVADGVGGWAASGRGGADAGRWSRLLTHFCEVEMGLLGENAAAKNAGSMDGDVKGVKGKGEDGWGKTVWEAGGLRFSTGAVVRKGVDPVEIMQRGYEKCLSCFTAEGIHGSSTCLLALLHNSTLSIANLGDCCLLLIRANEIVFRTDEMQHAFNFPLQLGTHSRDEPMKDAKRYDVGVSRGDIVVLGSDGLMDNLFDEDILETLAQFSPPDSNSRDIPFSPQQVSDELCRRARVVSETMSATTPFMVRAIEEGIDFVGGKKDDISVVVGVIGDRDGREGLALHTG